MATTLFTTQTESRTINTTIAGGMRDIAQGTQEIMRLANAGTKSGIVGLFLPNRKAFYVTFYSEGIGFYRIVSGSLPHEEMTLIFDSNKDSLMYSETWHSNGNAHGIIAAYIQAYVNELGENDNYWPLGLMVKYE